MAALLAAGAFAQQANESDPSGPSGITPQTWTKHAALGTLVAGPFDVETGPFDNRCLGVEEAGGFYWVTGRGHTTTGDNRRIHQYDLNGNYIASFPQVTNSTAWGGRDMAVSGTTLYIGSDSGEVSEYDISGGTPVHVAIYTGATTGVTGTTRALCLNPATGNFFTKDFTGNMQEFNLTTGLVNSFANAAISAYGFGWDETNAKIWSTTTGPGVEDVDPTTGLGMGNTFGPTWGVAQGGADIYEDARNPGLLSMIILGQGTPDSIELYDLDVPAPTTGTQLCSTFLDNNGQSGNMFDITPSVNLTIDSFDINSRAVVGTTAGFDFYYRVGTSFGFETDPLAWTFVGNYAGVSNGRGVPTNVSVAGNGITFLAGQTYGIYLDAGAAGGLAYTNGGPNTYSNADLSLTSNCGNASGFGSVFFPREWNGCVNYSVGGAPPLMVTVTGSCPGFMTFDLTGATPDGLLDVWFAFGTGAFVIPGGPCAGLTLGLDSTARVVGTVQADSSGNYTIAKTVSRKFCGHGHWQVVDLSTCTASNVVSF